jgi:DNA-binding transcriptional MerR regulator
MKDFLSIHEFAHLSGVEASTLRYWDEIGIFTPLTRNPYNNYRYYSTAQLFALNFVTTLSDLQIPLKTIAKLRKERSPEQLLELFEKQELQMDMEMRTLRLRYSVIHARRELINIGLKADENSISIVQMDAKPMILWPRNEYKDGESFIDPLAEHVSMPGEHGISLSFPVGGYFDSIDSFISARERPSHFFTLDPLGTHMRKAGKYLVGFARGYYSQFGDLPERMAAYAKDNSLRIHGPVYTVYLFEEISTNDPTQYLSQSYIAVK